MLIVVIFTFLKISNAAPTILFHREGIISPIEGPNQQFYCLDSQRSIWDIIWSCFATIFACSWVSVHPNMTDPRESTTKKLLRRLELMFWAIVAPEMIVMWAMRQWDGARKLAKQYKQHGWTKAHGFFIQMGGFMLYKDKEPYGILSPDHLEDLCQQGKINFPTVSEDEIKGRSKADALGKTIALGQTAWFIAQCIARHAQGLAVTELEIVTAALAVVNAAMYFLWLEKPLDPDVFIPVHLIAEAKDNSDNTDPGTSNVEQIPPPELQDDITRAQDTHPNQIFSHGLTGFMTSIRNNISQRSQLLISWLCDVIAKHDGIVWLLYDILLRAPAHAVAAVGGRLWDMFQSEHDSDITEGQMRVPTFFALDREDDDGVWVVLLTSWIAMTFGAIHCTAWSLDFPSRPEQLLWQICSAIITGSPFFATISMISGGLRNATSSATLELIFDKLGDAFAYLLVITVPAYIIGRLVLLVEALIGLRNLQPEALGQVDWTKFIPHVY